MFGIFNKKNSVQASLILTNFAAATFEFYRLIQDPDHARAYFLDMVTHLLTAYFAQNRIPTQLQQVASMLNACQAASVFTVLATGQNSPSFVFGIADLMFHLTNARLIVNEEAALAIYP